MNDLFDPLADRRTVMRVMTRWIGLARADLPTVGLTALSVAEEHWVKDIPSDLLESRVACWRYLDAKNGNSTTIGDREDHAMRALICVLFDDEEDLGDRMGFAQAMLEALLIDPDALRAMAADVP